MTPWTRTNEPHLWAVIQMNVSNFRDALARVIVTGPAAAHERSPMTDVKYETTPENAALVDRAMNAYLGLSINSIARVAHEVNRAYCKGIGDDSQPSWTDAPAWQQDSAVKGVAFKLKNPDTTPEQSHESWLREKEATGWKYGPVKDPEKKEHPCFVPYAELPESQRVKDYLFIAVVEALK